MFPGYLIPIHELQQAHSGSEIFIENQEHALQVLHAASTQVEQQCRTHSFMMHQSQLSRAGAFLPILDLPPPPQVFYERDRVLSRVSSRSSVSARAGSSSEDDHLSLVRPKKGNFEVKKTSDFLEIFKTQIGHGEVRQLVNHSCRGKVEPLIDARLQILSAYRT